MPGVHVVEGGDLMVTTRAQISTHGAIFTGQAARELRQTLDVSKKEVADRGETLIKQNLSARIQAGTGTYTGSIHTRKLGRFNDQLITDGGMVYGNWLESGKYSPPRRFRGYRAWRRTRQRLRKIAIQIAQRRIDRLVARWNS